MSTAHLLKDVPSDPKFHQVIKLVELRSYHDAKHFKQIELISISSLIITDFLITAYRTLIMPVFQ